MDPTTPDENHDPTTDSFEGILAECIDAYTDGDEARVEALCDEHGEMAERLRERMASLQRLGLLVGQGDDAPQRLGRYTISRRLGQGGMSVVYLAHDDRLDRRVALKTCPALDGGDQRVRARFEREIQAAAQLEHPGIVRIFDVGEDDGRPFFTMEYVEGATLAQILEVLRAQNAPSSEVSGASVARIVENLVLDQKADEDQEHVRARVEHAWPQTWVETVCRWMLDVAGALAHAHAAGILHRDVKPSNIIVGLDGRARLFDLGLARFEGRPGLTRSGDFTGTPYYVSPEQLQGSPKSLDHRSDVFSLGVTLYELLTWKRPFDGPSTVRVFKQIVDRDPVPPRRHDPDLPVDLETITQNAIEKDPDARYPSMEHLAADLQRFLDFVPVHARPAGALRQALRFVRRKPALALAGGLSLAILVGLPVGLFVANRAISAQRDLAQRNADEAGRQAELNEHVTEFLVDLFRRTPEDIARGESVSAEEILQRGASRIPSGFENQPLVRAALMRANGRVFHNMGLESEALDLLNRAFAIFHRELGNAHRETVGILHDLARVHLALGNRATSVRLSQRSLDGFEAGEYSEDPGSLQCLLTFADAVESDDGVRDALERIEAVLHARHGNGYSEANSTADLLERLSRLQGRAQATEPALASLRESIEIRKASWVPDPEAIAAGLERLAELHERAGDPEEAGKNRAEAKSLRAGLSPGLSPAVPRGEVDLATLDSPFALRPDWQEQWDDGFRAGIIALQVGSFAEAVQAFEACLELAPRHTICAYNLACSHALNGDVENALRWVEQAIDYGFGFLVDGPIILRKDPDLTIVRADPRWADLMQLMDARFAAVAEYAGRPRIYRPDAGDADARPLLIVLHADGSTGENILAGPWREVAERAGMVLFAPSARIPVSADISSGLRWFRDIGDYFNRPWAYETPVIEDIRAFVEKNEFDRRRVFIAGEGMGAFMAADIALSAPGLFRGALLFNGPFHPPAAGLRTRIAASLGLEFQLVLDARDEIVCLPGGLSALDLAQRIERDLPRWGLVGRLQMKNIGVASDESRVDVRIGALRALEEQVRRP